MAAWLTTSCKVGWSWVEDESLAVPLEFAIFVIRKGLSVAVRKHIMVLLVVWSGLSFLIGLSPEVLVEAVLYEY